MAASSPKRRPSRRRQRSVRVSVAAALMSLSVLAVCLALPTQSPGWLSLSSILSLLCGVTAVKIIHTELMQSRRAAAADRAAQAQAYRSLFSVRAEEHAEFTTAMTEQLLRRESDIAGLSRGIVLAERRALEAETRVLRETRRADQALDLAAELQEALEVRRAEEADELASWNGDGPSDQELPDYPVVDLLAWENTVDAGLRSAHAADHELTHQRHA